MYDEYRAKVVRVIDGDTVVLHIDQGFYSWTEQRIRVDGVDCPEREDHELWFLARQFTVNWLEEHARPYITLRPRKTTDLVFIETFARFKGAITSMDRARSLADDLIAAGHIKGS